MEKETEVRNLGVCPFCEFAVDGPLARIVESMIDEHVADKHRDKALTVAILDKLQNR